MNSNKYFDKKVKISGELMFETAFHIGSGKEGDLATNMGILKEADGRPILPGSTLKGNFRSFAEKLAEYLKFTTCLLDSGLSGLNCISDETYRKTVQDDFKNMKSESQMIDWLNSHTCDVCKFFGSPMQTSRIFFADGVLKEWGQTIEIRDGVCIDRDSEIARPKAKFDYEVVPGGTVFSIIIEIENPSDSELALTGAVIAEWENGFRLGGFTSRGLGQVSLRNTKIQQVDYNDPDQLKAYLISRKMTDADSSLKICLENILNKKGGNDA